MTPRISIDDQTLERLRKEGELQVEETHGIPMVLMTVRAREELRKLIYDNSEWTPEEMRAVAEQWLEDPEGWGAPGMEVYDEMYSDESEDHGESQ
jgi:hypothetical protein